MIVAFVLSWCVLGWLVITELSYLPGGSFTVWVYDRLAPLYPRKIRASAYEDVDTQERTLLAPLRRLCESRPRPLIFDLGCGSGRASLLLIRQPWFDGRIVAIDPSEAMLAQFHAARDALPGTQRDRIEIRRAAAKHFLGSTEPIDGCLLLEVGEFIPEFQNLIRVIAARLRPGGLFIMTRPPFPFNLLFPFRAQNRRALGRLLGESGLAGMKTVGWRRRYAFVHAWRPDTTPSPTVRGSTRSPA
jgi:SAM-dependent methyltransferase